MQQQQESRVKAMTKEKAEAVTKLQFQQFDVVTDFSDHKYAKSKNARLISSGSAVCISIMKEREVLQNNLPENIYVRAYEGRIDLLRAVIVGSSGTPYHNALFFFDFHFPPDYPNVPPKVHYNTFGLRGKFLWNILDTWTAPRWEPGRSSILQNLVSLRALVLNDTPFFNEPYKNYNYDVFVRSCQTMIFFLLIKKPKNFEGFIVEHFRSHGRAILTACRVYREGFLRVGHYEDDTTMSLLPAKRVHVPWHFKDSMISVYPRLVAAFAKNDPSLRNFIPWLDLMIRKTKKKYLQKERQKRMEKRIRRRKKFFGMLKKIFGLNKCAKSNVAAGIKWGSRISRWGGITLNMNTKELVWAFILVWWLSLLGVHWVFGMG